MAVSAAALSSTVAGGGAGRAADPAGAADGSGTAVRLAAGAVGSGGDLEPRPGAVRFDWRVPARLNISGTEHCLRRPPPRPLSTPDEAQSVKVDSSSLESAAMTT